MEIKKVANDGKSIKRKAVVRFLTTNGYRIPKEIWIGEDNFGTELAEISKKSLLSAIELNNRVFSEHPELLNVQ